MSPVKRRVEEERSELATKLEKLIAFMDTEAFARLSERARDLLVIQRVIMEQYRATLDERLTLM